jgi:two-component system, NarL family, sensor histidine kinase DesK
MPEFDKPPDRSRTTADVAVRTAQWAVLGLTFAYLSIPASRVIITQTPLRAGIALLALLAVGALQTRHTWHGLQGRPTVSWSNTLLWQALLTYLPIQLAGDAWLGVPSFLAASVLVLLRSPRGVLAFVLVVLAEAPFAAIIYDDVDDIAYACLATGLTGLVVYAFIRMARLVHDVHQLRATLAQRAIEHERLRFSRDLHDVLGHLLSAITLKGELAKVMVRVRPEDAERELAEIAELARTAHREIREVVAGYRSISLASELDGVTAVLKSAGMTCVVATMPLESVPPEASVPLAYALREGATNVLRHSTAGWCRITLRADAHWISLLMVNDGVQPVKDDSSSTGLRGLRERLAASHGMLRAGPLPDNCYELLVQVPIAAAGPAEDASPALVETR